MLGLFFSAMNYRSFSTSLWADDAVLSISPEQKYVFVYLHTNPYTSACGIYRLQLKTMSFQLGLTQDALESALKGLCAAMPDFVAVDCTASEVGLLQYPKQLLITASKKMMKFVDQDVEKVESQYLLRELMARNSSTLSKSYLAQVRRLQVNSYTLRAQLENSQQPDNQDTYKVIELEPAKTPGDLAKPPDNQQSKPQSKLKQNNNTTTTASQDFFSRSEGMKNPVLSDTENPGGEEPFFPLQAKKNHDQIPAAGELTQESDLSPEETTPPHSGPPPPAFVPDDPNGWAAKMFDPANKIGYFSTEARDKIFRYYDVDEALLAEARLAGRADLPILALRDLLGRFTTHQNFPAYAKQSPDFATLRQHFLRWLKGHRLDLTKVWFTAQELYDAILAKKPALQGVLTLESAALALENYTAWNTAKGLAMDAMLADELAACLVRAGSWAEAMGCMNFFAGRRDFMKNFRRQYEAWKEAWPKYKAEKI